MGFDLLEDKKMQLAEQIKTLIINLVHYNQDTLKVNLSAYLSNQLNAEYNHVSSIFLKLKAKTIEKYFIAQKN